MKNQLRIIALVTIAILFAVSGAVAQEEAEKDWSLDAGIEYSSIYLFRGSDLLDDEAVIWPWASWGWKGFKVAYYGYLGDLPGDDNYNEHDLSLDYTFSLGDKVSLTAGAITYQFNKDTEEALAFLDTYEVYGIVSVDTLLAPTLSYYHDVDKVEGGYASFGLSHSFPLGEKASVDLAGSVGFDFGYNNKAVSDGTLNDVLLGLNVPWSLTDHFSVHAQVQHSIALESLDERRKADPSLTGTSEDETIFTVGASLTF